MNPSHRRLKLTDAPSDPMVPAASAGGVPRSSDGKASGDRPAQVMSAIRRPNGHRDQITGPERGARFASVVLPHLADAYALARWLTGNSADAEDVVQDACLHAFRGIGNFSNGNARAWVLTIVRRTAYTWLGVAGSALPRIIPGNHHRFPTSGTGVARRICSGRNRRGHVPLHEATRPSDTETGSTRDLFPKSAARDRLGPAPLARQRARGIWTVTFALRSLRAVRPHSLEGERRPAFAAENPRDLRPAKRERRPRCRIRIARNRESRPSAP